ncbi:MAG: thiamine phosphate synthase [Pirellulales bacterium]
MQSELTPGAQRALLAATTWTRASGGAARDQLDVPEVLLGLLAEPECRAALLLAAVGVDLEVAQTRFSDLVAGAQADPERLQRATSEWAECLIAGQECLIDYPRPLTLATEHLLLCIMSAENDVSRWLCERGLLLEALEAEVHRLSGHQPGPLPIDMDEPWEPPQQIAGDSFTEPFEMPAHERTAALRVIDAAANRADEGLRVVEDYLRFVLDDRHLTSECKAIRHELASALAVVSTAERHAARDTRGDVGTDISLSSERTRATTADVAQASLKRTQQALRSLEEYCKTIAPVAAGGIEQLRYRSYTLERAVGITANALARLADVRLYVLIDAGPSVDAFRRLAESLVAAEVDMIQLREKRLPDRLLAERARLLAELTRDSDTLFVMNDRPDLTVLSGADGVHVGQDELSAKDARRILGPRGLVGVSTHSLDQARAAVIDGANYIGVGPTFPSGTKHFANYPGTDLLRAVAAEIRLPAFAIGGVTLENIGQVLATGISRVAVSGAIVGAVDSAAAATAFRRALDKS